MKIQKRFVALIVSVVLFALCAVVLTSCGECDHDFGEWVVTKEATCTTPGEAYRTCKLDSEHVETKVIDPVAHTYGDYVSDGKVTCTTNGTKTATCTACGYKDTVLEEPKGHSFTTYTPGGDATCTTGVPETAVCDREDCDATDVRYDGEALGHKYNTSGVCSVCSEEKPHLAKYGISAEGSSVTATVYETDKTIGSTKNIALLLKISGTGATVDFNSEADVPWLKEYGSKIVYVEIDDTVTAIGAYTFIGLEKLTDVTLSSSLTAIPAFAFAECEDLEEIEIPASVTEICNSAFIDCESLETVTIGENSVMTAIGESAFEGCRYLESINLPDGINAIYQSAFEGCKNLETLNVTSNITVFEVDAIKDTKIKTTAEKGAKYLAVGDNAYAILVSIDKASLEKETDDAKSGTILTINKNTLIIPELILVGYTKDVKVINVESENTVYSSAGNCIIKDGVVVMGVATSTIPTDTSVTTIGQYAFYDCDGLESIVIPANITSIGEYAFYGTTNLKTVVMANSVAEIGLCAFGSCSKLESVTLSSGLTTIGESAFGMCTAIKAITIPYGVTTVGTSAFAGCSSLETVIFPNSLERIENDAFANCGFKLLSIPEGVKYIGEGAFAACSALKQLTLPENAEFIGEYAFSGCTALASVEIPGSIGYIGEGAFYACTGLEAVSLYFTGSDANGTGSADFGWLFAKDYASVPALKTVNVLGSAPIVAGAFKNCTTIERVSISSTITEIGSEAFSGCTSLKAVYIESILAWCNINFADYYANPLYYAGNLYVDKKLVTELLIPEGVTSVGFAAFNGCTSITSVTLPATVETIETAAFKGCTALAEIVVPDSVVTIGSLAFANCGALKSVTLSANITELAPYVFSGCKELLSISIPASVTSISETAFIGCQRLAEVAVAKENSVYVSHCGIVYIAATKDIYFIPHSIAGKVELIDGITEIKAGAFLNHPHLDSLVVPQSVTKIGEAAFAGCTTLKSVTLPFIGQSLDCTENTAFSYVFGTVPATLKTVTILGGTKIADSAFKNCESIATVNLPEGITVIGKEAFENCMDLATIILPKSVKNVADDAFAECRKLRTVYYGGLDTDLKNSEGEFKITIGTNNVYLRGAKFYYFNDDTTSADGTGIYWYVDEEGEIVIW